MVWVRPLYHFDRDAKPDFLAASKTNSDAFAAAAEAVFDTSPVKDKTSDLKLNAVTNDAQRVPTGSVTASSENGLTWTADESAKKDLPNVVVISSKAPVQKAAEPPATKIASLVPGDRFQTPGHGYTAIAESGRDRAAGIQSAAASI